MRFFKDFKEKCMKMFTKFLFVSVAATGLLVAHPAMGDYHGGGYGHKSMDFSSEPKAPNGILEGLYSMATSKQKREILQLEYNFKKSFKQQSEKMREYRGVVMLDIGNLQIDLEEAKQAGDKNKAASIMERITKKQEEIRKSKQDEMNLYYLLNEDRIKKINEVLKVK